MVLQPYLIKNRVVSDFGFLYNDVNDILNILRLVFVGSLATALMAHSAPYPQCLMKVNH